MSARFREPDTELGGSLNLKLIEQQFLEILRLGASIKQGTVTASLILRKLGSYPRQNSLALALRELGQTQPRSARTFCGFQPIEKRQNLQFPLHKPLGAFYP
jgi:TnpA family transposase